MGKVRPKKTKVSAATSRQAKATSAIASRWRNHTPLQDRTTVLQSPAACLEPCRSSDEPASEPCRSSDEPASDYWDGLGVGDEPLPDLCFEKNLDPTAPQKKTTSGRRVVSLEHFMNALRELDDHQCPHSKEGRFVYEAERRVGLWSELTFTCNECGEVRKIGTDPVVEPTPLSEKSTLGVNDAAVWAFMSIGSGHSQLEEAMSVMEIPVMSKGTFLRREEHLGKHWKAVLLDQMISAGEEERKLAEDAGDFCEDGCTPHITVVVDGGWSHRSHGHRYSASSGVAVIIGERTKKLLYLAVRNKVCSTCEYYSRKKVEVKKHTCYRNWNQSSGAMEADILVEGFQRSREMHGLEYRTFIGDGDSSVHHQILSKVEYGRFVEKRECANHVVKCYTSRLYSIAKESKGCSTFLSGPRIKRLKNGARKAISHYAKILREFQGTKQERVTQKQKLIRELTDDLMNGPKHVFGCHERCKNYFCDGTKGENVYENIPRALEVKIMSAATIISEKAGRFVMDDTSNLAEAAMSLVAKFAGGKQVNRCQKGSYEHRCSGAGLNFQLGPQWHSVASEAITRKSPHDTLKRYAQKRMKIKKQEQSRRKRVLEESGPHEPRRKNRTVPDSLRHYGPNCEKPDMPPEIFSVNAERLLKSLQVDEHRLQQIEEATRGQADNSVWHVERRFRLTASNFHAVCTRKDSTPCDALVKSLVCKKGFTTTALQYGKQHEQVALRLYESQKLSDVVPCGLFVDLEHGFLAASPDGLVGSDGIVEVKCPLTAKDQEPAEAAKKFCDKTRTDSLPVLSRSHKYFYQIQGQLHVTRKRFCDFVVYTSKGIHVQRIQSDEAFWKTKMAPLLLRFYRDCILPEIVDPRLDRSMSIRQPEWNRLAFEAKRKMREETPAKSKRVKGISNVQNTAQLQV